MARFQIKDERGSSGKGAASPRSTRNPSIGWDSLDRDQQKAYYQSIVGEFDAVQGVYDGIMNDVTGFRDTLGTGWKNQTVESFGKMQRYLTGLKTRLDQIQVWQDFLGDEAPEELGGNIETVRRAYETMQKEYDTAYGAWDREQHRPIIATESFGQTPGQVVSAFGRQMVEPAAGTPMQMFPGAEEGDPAGRIAGYSWRQMSGLDNRSPWDKIAEKAAKKQGALAARRQEELLAMDPEAMRAEADRIQDIYDRAVYAARVNNDTTSMRGEIAAEGVEDGRELARRASELRQQATQAERFQQQAKMTEDAASDPYFEQFVARGERVQNPEWDRVLTGLVREEPVNLATFARDNLDKITEWGQTGAGSASLGDNSIGQATRMTDEERAIYSYYLGRYGKQAADMYFESLVDTLNAREGRERAQEAKGSTLRQLGIGWNAGVDQFLGGIGGAARAVTGDDKYVPVSAYQYAGGYARQNMVDAGRSPAGKWVRGAAYDITQTTANMLPSILLSTAATVASEGALGPEAAGYLGEAAGALTIGATAGGSAYDEMIRMGYTRDQARGYAALAGASEAGLQYLIGGVTQLGGVVTGQAVGRLIQNIDNGLARTAIQLGGEFLSEGFEEYLQDVLEPVFRNLVLYEDNEVKFLSADAIYSGILGGLSALIMSGGGTVTQNVQTYRAGLELQRAGITGQRIAELGLTLPADSAAYQLASRVSDKTGAYTMGRLFNDIGAVFTEQNVADIQQALIERGVEPNAAAVTAQMLAIAAAEPDALTAIQQEAMEKDEVLASVIRDVLLDRGSAVGQRIGGMQDIRGDLELAAVERAQQARRRRQEREERKNRSPEANAVNDQLRRAAGEEVETQEVDAEILARQHESLREILRTTPDERLVTALKQKREEVQGAMTAALDAGRGVEAETYRRVNEVMTGAAKAYMDAGQDIRALRDYINDNTGGVENGGADLSGGDGGRIAGESAGVEAGDVRPVDEGAVGEGEGYGRADDGLAETEPRSSRDLGVKNGTDSKINRPVPREAWSEDMRTAADQAAALGYDVTYVSGSIEVEEGGRVRNVSGCIDMDSGRIVVRADSKMYSAQALVAHEVFHARAAADPELVHAALDRLVSQVGYPVVERLIQRYAEKYESIYGDLDPRISDEQAKAVWYKYFEEIAADAYAGIIRQNVGRGAEQFTDTVRELVQEREGMGNGSGGMPGDVRYSFLGYDEETGKGVYRSNFPIGTPRAAKAQQILHLIQDVWSKKPIDLRVQNEDGSWRTIQAQFDPTYDESGNIKTDASKLMGGNRHGTSAEQRVTLDLADDYYQIASDAQYNYSKEETGKDSPTHEGVQQWHYFVNDILFQEYGQNETAPYTVTINVKERADGSFVYSFNAERQEERSGTRRTLHADVNQTDNIGEANAQPSGNSIPSSTENSNPEFGLRSRFPDLTRWDREATALAEAERNAAAETQQTPERGQMYSIDEEDIPQSAAEYAQRQRQQLTEEQRQEIADRQAERESLSALRRQVNEDRANLKFMDKFAEEGGLTEQQEQSRRELKQKLEREQDELKTRERKFKREKAAAQERARQRQSPSQTKRDFIKKCMDTMSTAPGMRQELGVMAADFFDTCLAKGYVDESMFNTFVDRLIDAGAMTVQADPTSSAIRGDLSGIRLYIPEDLRADLAPDAESYNALRREAMSNGIILTSDPTDAKVDSVWQEFREMYPGTFRASDTDMSQQLTELIDLAKEGRDENVTMYEMMQRVQDNEGFSVSEQIDRYTNKLRNYVEQAMYAAGIEMGMKAWAGRKISEARQEHREAEQRQRERHEEIEQREHQKHLEIEQRQRERYAVWQANENARRKDMLKKQAERRQLTEMHQRDLKGLQRLARQRDKLPPGELRREYDRILDQFNIYTMRMANEAQYSPKYGATFRDIVDVYRALQKSDPNWKPSKEIEEMIARLDLKAVGDLDMDAAIELHNAISKLEHEYHNRNNMLADERHRLYSDVYSSVVEEVGSSGGKGRLPGFFRNMLTKVNLFEMMGGWNANGELYGLGKQLQAGERAMKGYIVTAQTMLRDFTRENAKWLRRADGRGRDAIWHEYELPVFKGRDIQQGVETGNSAVYGETVKIYMTPLMRVQLALEADNYHNTTHMEGGRTFADKKLYAKGKTQDAFAQGQTVALSRETVMSIVKDMSPEERALYDILKNYYNVFAHDEINRVSNIIDGYDRAITENYAPEFTNTNYVMSDPPGIFDLTAAGVGHMKRREQVSMTPTYNISALDAFERHVNQTSRYVGLSIPIKNLNTVLNWFGDGTTTKDTIARAWGADGVKAIEDIMRKVQAPKIRETTGIERMSNKIQSNYIGSTFAMNPKITLKQNASYPTAAAVLGWRNMPKPWQLFGVDEDVINRYTPELAHRKLGYGTPEAATMKENPNILDRTKWTSFLFRGGAITWMDAVTVKSIWPWAENFVQRERADLEVGSEMYYKAVADAFNEAVNTTQPMYDVMNRASIMDSDSDVVRTLMKFKTVPMQELNTLIKYAGEARHGGKKERLRLAGAVGALTASTVALEVVEMGFAYLLNGMKYYRDDDGELTYGSVMKKFGKNMLIDTLSIIPGGSLFYDAWTYILSGGKRNDQNGVFEIFGTEQINDIIGGVAAAKNLFEEVAVSVTDIRKNGGDVSEYFRRNGGDIRGQVLHLANLTATYTGLPAENTEKYIGGLLGRIFPEAKANIDGWFDTSTKADLGRIYGDELESRLGGLLAIRGIDVDDGTAAELARLYQAGEKSAVPVDTPTSIRVNGEAVELTAFDLQTYDNAYKDAIGASLDTLVESDAYLEADDKTRARMLDNLYEYAAQNAARAVEPEYEGDKWTLKAAEAERENVPVSAIVALRGQGFDKDIQKMEYIDGLDLTDEQKGGVWYWAVASESQREKADALKKTGGTVASFFDLQKNGLTKQAAKVDCIDEMTITADKKAMLYYHAVASEERQKDIDAMRSAGMRWSTVWDTMTEYLDVDAMQDTSANIKAATFKTWAYENLTDKERAAALENLTFSSGFKAETTTYDRLVGEGLEPDEALSVVNDWGALEPEEGKAVVTEVQKIRAVALSNRTNEQKFAAIAAVMGPEMTNEKGEPTTLAKVHHMIDAGVSWTDYVHVAEAGAVGRWQRLYDVGVSANGAVSGAVALAALEPEEGKDTVSDQQRMQALVDSGMNEEDQFAALYITASSDAERWKLDRVYDYGISAAKYVEAKGMIRYYYDYNPKGSAKRLDQTEVQYALANVPGLSNDQRAVLWQTQDLSWKGSRNPFNVHVGQSIYGDYESWKAAGSVYSGQHKAKETPTPASSGSAGGVRWPALPLSDGSGTSGSRAAETEEPTRGGNWPELPIPGI